MQRVVLGAVVVATRHALLALLASTALLHAVVVNAAILPEDRADIMYHGYEGGGLEVTGPSVLVRKAYKDKVSVWGNYYVDMITSASIDVMATASEYEEERKEKSIGVDYLTGKTFMGMSYTNSEESDYSANSWRFGISQDFLVTSPRSASVTPEARTRFAAMVMMCSKRKQIAKPIAWTLPRLSPRT